MAFLPHFADSRRKRGRYFRHRNGYGQVEQYPVICAVDIVEQEVTQASRAAQVVTDDVEAVGCPDCRSRLKG